MIRYPKARSAASLAALLAVPGLAWAVANPEQETLRVSKLLRPISDEEWGQIAGERVGEKYEVAKGDTLYDISGRLFGDNRYWPKVWALNNSKITNPHVINPGDMVTFLPGTGTSLPEIGPEIVPEAPKEEAKKGRSDEWRYLPRQPWENVTIQLPPEVDPLGFDSRSKITFAKATGFELHAFAATDRVPISGELVGSRSEGSYLTLGDTVYIEAEASLQVGEEYTITQPPDLLKSRRSDRIGYTYLNLGSIKIIAVRDDLFVGTVTSGKMPMFRGAALIPRLQRITTPEPIPGPKPLEGILMVDHDTSTYTTAQHKLVYVDKGTDDGIQPGMVFRVYQYYDPSNERKITSADFIIDADVLVVHVTPKFCTGMVIKSLSPITENSTAILLTDVSDVLAYRQFRQKTASEQEIDSLLDELDTLDSGEGLGREEAKVLKQLERWKGNPAAPGAEGAPEEEKKEEGLPELPPLEEAPTEEPQPGPEPLPEEVSATEEATATEEAPAEALPPLEETPPAEAPPGDVLPPAEEALPPIGD